jgi:hypothetical protein
MLDLMDKVSERDALEGKSAALGNIGLIYSAKGDLDQTLKYLNQTLRIFTGIGMPTQAEQTKRTIESILREKEQMKHK